MNVANKELRDFLAGRVIEVAERKGVAVTISDELALIGGDLLDSLDFLNLLMEVEQRFALEIDFSERDIAEVTRFGALVDSFVASTHPAP